MTLQNKSLNLKNIDYSQPYIEGKVLSCSLSTAKESGTRIKSISNIIYQVIVVVNNKKVLTYSKEFFNKGDTIYIAAKK